MQLWLWAATGLATVTQVVSMSRTHFPPSLWACGAPGGYFHQIRRDGEAGEDSREDKGKEISVSTCLHIFLCICLGDRERKEGSVWSWIRPCLRAAGKAVQSLFTCLMVEGLQ